MEPSTLYVIGECMIELRREGAGLAYRFGGDTLNTAVYLARLIDPKRFHVAYVTALGTDSLSDEMCAAWADEGIATDCVQRLPAKLPGMYLIENDASGERRFHYWRSDSAARYWLRAPRAGLVTARLETAPCIYLSGISLAILAPDDRERLLGTLAACRARGGRIVFDNNYRPALWESASVAAEIYERVLALSDIALLTLEDEQQLRSFAEAGEVLAHARSLGVAEVVLKRGADACTVQTTGVRADVPAGVVCAVVDTTAAGDSFGAAYLAARLAGHDPISAVRAGHRLAGVVIRHPGAIIPRSAMPADMRDGIAMDEADKRQ